MIDASPPRLARLLLLILVPHEAAEEIVGDVHERFVAIARGKGLRAARAWYWRQVLAMRPLGLRRAARGRGGAERARVEARPWSRGEGSRATNGFTTYGGGGWMGGSWTTDLKLAYRGLRRRPGTSLTLIATVGLAIGATTSVFTVVNGVLLRPLPYPEPARLVRLWQTQEAWRDSPSATLRGFAERLPLSMPTFMDWREQSSEFQALGLHANWRWTLRDGDSPEVVRGVITSSGVFDALRVEPTLGRRVLPEDDAVGAPPVLVLSYREWQSRFASDPRVLERTMRLDEDTYTIVGVMPPEFDFPAGVSFWTSLPEEVKTNTRDNQSYSVIGRLTDGATLESARAEMTAIQARLAEQYPDDQGEFGFNLMSYMDSVVGSIRSTIWFLFGAVGLVLLIACVNIANVLSAISITRRRELAVKSAIGAGAGRLARGQLAEALLLAGTGGLLGLILASATLPVLLALLPTGVPRQESVTLDAGVLAFGALLTLVTTVLVGVLPALEAGRVHPARTIRTSERGGTLNKKRAFVLGSLVVSEVALAFVLLVAAALLGNSFLRLWTVDRGFDPEGLLVAWITPDRAAFPERADELLFTRALRQRLEAIPGVRVSASNQIPLGGSISSSTFTYLRPDGETQEFNALRSVVLDNYFDVMGIPVLRGRAFDGTDTEGAPYVAIVNEAAARAVWADENPIGKTLRRDRGSDTIAVEIVGLVRNVRHQSLATPTEPKIYFPVEQVWDVAQWVLRTGEDLTQVSDQVRQAVAQVSPGTPVRSFTVLSERIRDSVALPRFRTGFVVSLALVAAFLALLGVYGVVAFAVTQRTREIGVRMALGSDAAAVVRKVLVGGMRFAVFGLVIGLTVAVAAAKLLAEFLYEIEPTDPLTLAATVVLVAGVCAAAAYVPARRASRVDPVKVLGAE